jgi:protein TonB
LEASFTELQVEPLAITVECPEGPVIVKPKQATVFHRRYKQAQPSLEQPPIEKVLTVEELLPIPRTEQSTRASRPRASTAPSKSDEAPTRPCRRKTCRCLMPQFPSPQPRAVSSTKAFGLDDRIPPKLLNNPPPVYPTSARMKGIEGVVHLRVEILIDGTGGTVEVVESSGYEILDGSAARNVRRWRFEPARIAVRPNSGATGYGEAVRVHVRFPVRFRINKPT